MDRGTMWGIALAPIIGPAFWWLAKRPGSWLREWLDARLPEGRLRRILFRKVSG